MLFPRNLCRSDSERDARSINDAGVQFKFLVPSSVVGAVLGRGGSTVAAIKRETGAYVQVRRPRTAAGGAVVIVGCAWAQRRRCSMMDSAAQHFGSASNLRDIYGRRCRRPGRLRAACLLPARRHSPPPRLTLLLAPRMRLQFTRPGTATNSPKDRMMIVAVERRDQLPKAITLVLQVRVAGLALQALRRCNSRLPCCQQMRKFPAIMVPACGANASRHATHCRHLQAAMPTRACAVPPALLLQAIEREGAMDKLRTKQFAADKLFLQQVRLRGSAAVPAFASGSAVLCMDVAPAFLAAVPLCGCDFISSCSDCAPARCSAC